MSAYGTQQVSDFQPTGSIANSDIFYALNVNTGIEQKTTALQIQQYVQAPIINSSLPAVPALDGTETFPLGKSGLFQTTLSKIQTFVLSVIAAGSSTAAGTLTGTESITVGRAGSLVSTTIGAIIESAIGQFAPQRQSIPVTSAGQALFTSIGYTPTLVNVFIAGVRLDPSQYQALDGETITITDESILNLLVSGMTIDLEAAVTMPVANAATPASVALMDPSNQPAIGTIVGSEIISTRQGSGLFQITLTKIAQWAIGTYQGFTQSGTGAIVRTLTSKLQDTVNAKDFGVTANGVTDDTLALQAAVNYAFLNSRPLQLPTGIIITSAMISYVAVGTESVGMVGSGIGLTTIVNNNFNAGLSIVGNSATLTKVMLSGFSIGRTNTNSYTGAIGPKSIYVEYANDSSISNVEEFGAIGYGIQFDNSTNCTVRDCVAHDHFGGSSGPAGVDGIHFYRCMNGSALNNIVYNVADDCISFGSYTNTAINTGARIIGNRCYSSGGSGVKLYGLVTEALVADNNIDGTGSGGVQLSDDFYNFTGVFGPQFTRVKISNNLISNVTGGASNIGGVYLNSWSGGAAGLVSSWTDIEISNNQIYNCNSGISQRGSNTDQYQVNLDIIGNKINGGSSTTNTGHGIYLVTWYGQVNIKRNQFLNVPNLGIWLDGAGAGYLATGWTNARVCIEDNLIDGWNKSLAPAGTNRGIWFRTTDISVILTVRNNITVNQASSAASALANSILLAACSPLSVISQNYGDSGGMPNYNSQFGNGCQGDVSVSALPNYGTWYAGQKIYNSVPSTSAAMYWICATAGTFGTLNGSATTGTIASGSAILTLSSVTGLFKGAVIAIAGITGSFIVTSINGTTVMLNAPVGAAATAAVVSFVPPTFKTSANYA